MATLNTLRTKGGVIVTTVIGISLVAFLLGDLAGNNSIFGPKMTVGEINNSNVSYNEYLSEVDYLTNVNKIISGSDAISQEEQNAINNYAWEKLFNQYSVSPGYKNLGIGVSDQEMFELIYGNNISPVLQNAGFFNNQQTGVYDKTLVKNFVTNLSTDQTGRLRTIWGYLQEQVQSQTLTSKYVSLISKMVYVTNLEVEQGVKNANNFYNANYVGKTYESVADSLVKVTSADIKEYYNKHINYFKQAASRDIEYVMFEVAPSQQDMDDAKKHIETLAGEFAVAENPAQFVTLNSQSQLDTRYLGRDQLPVTLADFAFNTGKAGMYGPSLENNTYTIARVTDTRLIPDTISLKQIFIAPGSEKLADSLLNVLNGDNFDALAAQYSSAGQNSDMGAVPTSSIPTQLLDQILNTPKGKVSKIDNPNGTMLVYTYARSAESPKVQLAVVRYDIEPSEVTQQAAYAKSSAFISAVAGSSENFNKTITDNAYSKRVARVKSSDNAISGLENSKELVRWAFNSEDGDVSNIMEIDGNYLIASLVATRKDGIAPVSQVSSDITLAVRNEKKAEYIIEKLKGAKSLDEAAQKIGGTIGAIDELNFNARYIPSLGVDISVIGAVCGGAKEGAISKPIKAMTGVYVVDITSMNTKQDATAESERVRLEAVNEGYIDERAMQAMRDLSFIKDSRVKYF